MCFGTSGLNLLVNNAPHLSHEPLILCLRQMPSASSGMINMLKFAAGIKTKEKLEDTYLNNSFSHGKLEYPIWLIQFAAARGTLQGVFEPIGGWLLKKHKEGVKLPSDAIKKMVSDPKLNQKLTGKSRSIFDELRR